MILLAAFGYLRELEDKYELGYGIHATPLTTDSPIRRADGGDTGGVEQKVEQYVEQFAENASCFFVQIFT